MEKYPLIQLFITSVEKRLILYIFLQNLISDASLYENVRNAWIMIVLPFLIILKKKKIYEKTR